MKNKIKKILLLGMTAMFTAGAAGTAVISCPVWADEAEQNSETAEEPKAEDAAVEEEIADQTDDKTENTDLKTVEHPRMSVYSIRRFSIVKDGEEVFQIKQEPADYKMDFDYWEITNPYDETATVNTENMYEMFGVLAAFDLSNGVDAANTDTGLDNTKTYFTVDFVNTVNDDTAKETQDSASEEIKAHLLSLGFPEEILHDLKEEDILACKNARQILLNQSDDLLRDGDERLQLDGVAVELEQEGQWKVIHHFLWNGNPGFRGTEAVQINPAYQELNGGWTSQGKLTGQVLYDKDGTSYTADYKILQDENYDTGMNAFFYGSQQNASIFAEFSLPRSGENCRGYVAYEIKAKESDWWIDSWLNYTHQKTIWQYPVISAAQNRKQGGWLNERVFSTVQDALQVLPEGENEGSIGS